jgi:LPXTG-motif cell wall-anchored protein
MSKRIAITAAIAFAVVTYLLAGTAAAADFGPIPRFELVTGCQIRFDPPSYINVHLVNATDGATMEQWYGYTPDADHWVYVDMTAVFGTDHGTVWSDRWSLGTGDTAHVDYDCRPAPPTTTTTSPTPTTTVPPPTTTTPPVRVPATSEHVVQGPGEHGTMPNTGGDLTLPAGLGLGMVGTGTLILRRRR